jgi:hypothetical protein
MKRIFLLLAVVVFFPAFLHADFLYIEGSPLRIGVNETSQMYLTRDGVDQYWVGDCWGSVLFYTDSGAAVHSYSDDYHLDDEEYTNVLFTPASNLKDDDWTITTTMNTPEGITVTQTTAYVNGASEYSMRWIIRNDSSEAVTDVKFFHGGDAFFGGDDNARSYYNSALDMIYLRNEGVSGIMGFLTDPTTRSSHYFGGDFGDGNNQILAGLLSDTADPEYQDAGYDLQWNKESLAPGEEWTIIAYERFTEASSVQVYAPPASAVQEAGVTNTCTFVVQNMSETEDTFNFEAASESGWVISLSSGSAVIPADSSVSVDVFVLLPLINQSPVATIADTLNFTATSATTPSVTASGATTNSVLSVAEVPSYDVQIDAPAPLPMAAAGIINTCAFVVHNLSSMSDTFDFTVSSAHGWTTGMSAASATIAAGETATINVMVTLPTVSIDVDDLLIFTATSQGDPTVTATATTTNSVAATSASEPASSGDYMNGSSTIPSNWCFISTAMK